MVDKSGHDADFKVFLQSEAFTANVAAAVTAGMPSGSGNMPPPSRNPSSVSEADKKKGAGNPLLHGLTGISVLDLAGRMRVKNHVCTRFATKIF